MEYTVDGIRTFLDMPRQFDQAYSSSWPVHADRLIPSTPTHIDQLAAASSTFLENFPYAEAGLYGRYAHKSPENLAEMRFLRKALMVGRDTLNLINATDLIAEPLTKDIPALTTLLGKIADTRGTSKTLRKRAPESAEAAAQSAVYIGAGFVLPVSPAVFRARTRRQLEVFDLVDPEPEALMAHDEEQYHTARRSFRSVVHLAISHYLLDPSDENRQLAQQGVELNRVFGNNHDLILDAQAS